MVRNQLRDDFGVRLALEDDAFLFELAPDGEVILNHAVVHDGDQIVATDMRMGVQVGRRSMRGPPSMADANGTRSRLTAEERGEFRHAPGALANVQTGV